jgi:peroxiredoxin
MSTIIDFTYIGPAVGERFPDVSLPDQHGRIINLHQTRARRRAVVLFHRSASW